MEIYFSHGQRNSKVVMILLNNNLDQNVQIVQTDPQGTVSIQTLCYEPQNLAQVLPVSNDPLWDISTISLESPCGKLNCLDMI